MCVSVCEWLHVFVCVLMCAWVSWCVYGSWSMSLCVCVRGILTLREGSVTVRLLTKVACFVNKRQSKLVSVCVSLYFSLCCV